jgi:hypothetical protein
MTLFDHLRTTPFEPTFTWVPTAAAAADRINSFHEDYPRRVAVTQQMLELPFRMAGLVNPRWWWPQVQTIEGLALEAIHWLVFNDQPFRGQWRSVNVRIGDHRPPPPHAVPELMEKLQAGYREKITCTDDLVAWYTDFETIHPFQDGNGRVGGIVVAAFAHARHPEQGWLAANQ